MNAINGINLIESLDREERRRSRREKSYKQRKDILNETTDEDFIKKYRLSKQTVGFVIDLLRDALVKDPRGGSISVELQVLTALRCWGRREVQDDAGDLHGISQPTVSRICARVADALAQHANEYIKMPSTPAEQQNIMDGFRSIANLPSVIGAIDCTHIKIKKTGGDAAQYFINRKGFYSMNVQVVCDSKLLIRDIVARWRGSTHDSRIFTESHIKERFRQREFRGRLLGDSGYPLLPYLFTPILRPVNSCEEHYNRAHISTRNPVERCFGVWKQRFRCLLDGLTVSYENGKTLIVALAVLHNIALTMHDGALDDEVILVQEHEDVTIEHEADGAALRRHSRFILDNFIRENFQQ